MSEAIALEREREVAATASVDEEDRAWLSATAAGDRAAFERLYRAHCRAVARFVWRLVPNEGEVDEVVNETMLVVWRKAGTFRGDARVSTWILAIAFRIARKRMQRRRRLPATVPIDDLEMEAPERLEDVTGRRQARAAVRAAVSQLPPLQRAVVELTFGQELSYPEVAAVLGCPVGTVKTRMFAARARLRCAVPAAIWELLP